MNVGYLAGKLGARKMDKNYICVAYITDMNYSIPTCTSVASLLMHKKEDNFIKVYVIGVELAQSMIEIFRSMSAKDFEIEVIEVAKENYNNLFKDANRNKKNELYVSVAALAKFDLANLLHKEDKVLYLDCDTIVQDGFEEIYLYQIEDHYLAAVNDWFDYTCNGFSSYSCRIESEQKSYFNSGVMLLNLKLIRQHDMYDALIEYRKHGKNYFMDQDTLNAVLGKKRMELPYKYNFISLSVETFQVEEMAAFLDMDVLESVYDYVKEARIIHFAGRYKPWDYDVKIFSDIYRKYFRATPIFEKELELKQLPIEAKSEGQVQRYYVFPYDKIKENEDIILYGAGEVGTLYYRQIQKTGYCNIVHWVDKAYADKSDKVESVDVMKTAPKHRILIAVMMREVAKEIASELQTKYGVTKENIVYI